VLQWVNQEGDKFFEGANSIGSNSEEANHILARFNKFEEGAAVSGSG